MIKNKTQWMRLVSALSVTGLIYERCSGILLSINPPTHRLTDRHVM